MKNFTRNTLSIFALALSMLFISDAALAQQEKGNGTLKSETRNVSGFNGIKVSGGFAVEIKLGKQDAVRIEAEENLLDNIYTVVKDGVLHIYSKGSINSRKGLKAYITVDDLNKVEISGGVKVVGLSTFKANTFNLDMSGGSQVELAIDAKKIDADMSGASKVTLTGRADEVTLDMSGASDVNAKELKAKRVSVEASGASRVSVHASENLNISASGASHVAYAGTPRIEAETTAASRISKL